MPKEKIPGDVKQIIGKKDINELYAMYDRLHALQSEVQDHVNTAKARTDNDDVTVRRDGKDITVKTKVLWTELWHLGADSSAGQDLRRLFPEVFEAKDREDALTAEIKAFELKAIGFDHRNMTLPNLIKLVRGLID